VSASDIGDHLWPDVLTFKPGRPTGAMCRLAQALRKLADKGRIVRLRHHHGSSSNYWTLEGREVDAWITKQWVVAT